MSVVIPRDSKGRFIGWIDGCPKEVAENISNTLMGHILTDETKDSISVTLKAKDSSNWDYLKIPKTPAIKEKIKLGMLGKHNSVDTEFKKGCVAPPDAFKKGHIPWNKNKEWLGVRGENHWNWKDGISRDKHSLGQKKYREWRNEVFIHDNYTCLKCRKKGIYLHAHHIYNFAEYFELRYMISNGITFCRECHRLFHKIYGTKNNTKEQVKEFIKDIIIKDDIKKIKRSQKK